MRTVRHLTAAAVVVAAALGSSAGPANAAASPPGSSVATTSSVADEAQPIGTSRLVSVKADGSRPGRGAFYGAVSDTGRFVAFQSTAKGIVEIGPTHHKAHIYLRDRETATTVAIDVRPDGKFGNDGTDLYSGPSISADGRFVAFSSYATNLTPGGFKGDSDVFVRDTLTGTTTLVSVAADGGRANGYSITPAISADGSVVAFTSYASNLVDDGHHRRRTNQIYHRDLASAQTTLVSRTSAGDSGNRDSLWASVSHDGNLVTYSTHANDIVPGGACHRSDVVLYDVAADQSTLVNAVSGATPDDDSGSPSISADGSTICYSSLATNLVPDDTNGASDIFGYDVGVGTTTLLTLSTSGEPADSSSYEPAVDADGSTVTFESYATDLVADDDNGHIDAFVLETTSGVMTLLDRTPAGEPSNSDGRADAISGDGSIITYMSAATDLQKSPRSPVLWAYRLH